MANWYPILDFTPSSFNPEVASEYDFRIEPVQINPESGDGKFPTVRRLRVWYRDLGVVNAVFTLYGMYEDGTTDSQVGTLNGVSPCVLGTAGAPGTIKQAYIDFTKTMLNPQLKLTVGASQGPLAITRITGIGDLRDGDTI